jgi:hypothetical protein
MALQNVTIKFSAKKADGTQLAFTPNAANNNISTELTGTGATRSAAEQQITDQITISVSKAQGGLDDQQAAQSAFSG